MHIACSRRPHVVNCLLQDGVLLHYASNFWTAARLRTLLSYLPKKIRIITAAQHCVRRTGSSLEEKKVLEEVLREVMFLRPLSSRVFAAGHAHMSECIRSVRDSKEEFASLICAVLPPEMLQHVLSFKFESIGVRAVLSNRAVARIFRLILALSETDHEWKSAIRTRKRRNKSSSFSFDYCGNLNESERAVAKRNCPGMECPIVASNRRINESD